MTVKAKTAFFLSILVIAIVIIAVWLTGLKIHRTILDNSMLSLTVLTTIFFVFVTYGLYKGVKLHDDFGDVKSKIGFVEPSGSFADLPIGDFADDGLEGIVVGIILWIVISVFVILFVILFETIIFSGLMIFTAMLYWVFYRATRLILRYARLTKNNFYKSMWIGLRYSLLYSGWIYLLLWAIERFKA